jgi:DNA-binding PadR family transcriptional regulator
LHPAKERAYNVKESRSSSRVRPRGAPRGLLFYYILHRLSIKPSHGYELLQDIDSKTDGAWRPGPGSIYPMLKKLLSKGYIKVHAVKNGEKIRRLYSITPKGMRHIQETKKMFSNAGQRWSAIRGLFIDLIEPEHVAKFLLDGLKGHFELVHEIVRSKGDEITSNELEYVLKEYALNLEREGYWVKSTLKQTFGEASKQRGGGV